MAGPKTLSPPAAQRLGSLDAYRGLVMVALASRGFGIHAASKNFPDSPFWQTCGGQFEHVPWIGCAFWDLIQPSFMFMVGVSLPFSYARRYEQGHSTGQLAWHAVLRALLLVFLGVFLASQSGDRPTFEFTNVLAQIGLGYVFLFLLWNRPAWLQLLIAQFVLIAYWAWFAMTPIPDLDLTAVGVPEDWPHKLSGFAAHWQKNANPAARFDVWFLNLFPREQPFVFNGGGYATLNFIPSLVTMLFGLMTGEAIRNAESKANVIGGLVICAALGLASGWALNYFGFCPLVKRIWTPSWTLFSTGWCWLILAGFYAVVDGLGFDAWSFPLKVAGMNSIVLYLMGQMLPGWTETTLKRFFGAGVFTLYRESLASYEPLIRCNLVLICFWLFVFWLYRQRLFVRL
jgi:heparan-alpha-glucosaminide N-acetyltransferase